MSDIMKCPHCSTEFELISATESNRRGRVRFESLLCPGCGTRRETRQIGSGPTEVLMTSQPRAVTDKQAQERADAVAEGVKEFFCKSQGGIHAQRI